MGCMSIIKNALRKLGWMQQFTTEDVRDAKTEDLVKEREQTINELNETTQKFFDKSAALRGQVSQKKDGQPRHRRRAHLDRGNDGAKKKGEAIMIDDYLNPVTLLQTKNAFIFLLNVSMMAIFLSILITDRASRWRPYYKALIFIAIYFLGEGLEQLWYWIWRHYANGNRAWLTDMPLAILLGINSIIAIGGIGIIKLFTLERYGHRLWLGVLLICLVFAALSPLIPK